MTNRVNELEQWLKVLRRCAACQVNFDMWNDRASSFASAEARERMRAEDAQSRREQAEAERELEALIIKTRVEEPAALATCIQLYEANVPDSRAKLAQSDFATLTRARRNARDEQHKRVSPCQRGEGRRLARGRAALS